MRVTFYLSALRIGMTVSTQDSLLFIRYLLSSAGYNLAILTDVMLLKK